MTADAPLITRDEIDFAQVAEELAEATIPPMRRPGDVTVEDYRQAVHRKFGITLTYRQAEYRLSRLVDKGEVRKLRVWDDLHKRECTVYRCPAPDPEDEHDV